MRTRERPGWKGRGEGRRQVRVQDLLAGLKVGQLGLLVASPFEPLRRAEPHPRNPRNSWERRQEEC